MRKLTVDQLEPGMILAKPLLKGTAVFVGEGMALTDNTIDRIRMMEIGHVFVEGKSAQAGSLEEALSLLNERFRYCGNNTIMMHIRDITEEHIRDLYE